jgi:4-methylaminobutanoate oxidase (formaldehyde-forming)
VSTVVVGGGIAGVSCAYHLAKTGVLDVVLVEKGELTSGSTHHAAGLVTQFNPSPTMMRFRRYSVQLYEELGVFERVGSLRIASSEESFLELRRGVSRAHAIGLDAELVGPEEARRHFPAVSPDSLFGAVWMPGDGYVDPHIASYAVASAARELGVEIRTRTLVTGIDVRDGRVTAVQTEHGPIECETVVNAAGMWAPRVAQMVGAFVCSIPVDHQHVALHAVEGHELPRDTPCFRDTDNLVYGKAESGGVLFGGYEPNPVSRWEDGVPWDHGARALPPDHARFEQLMAGAVRRFPFLDDAGLIALVCHPDAMTPDGNPLLGEMPGVRGFWLAAGLSLNGFGGAGGLGKALAELVTEGAAEVDVQPYRPWRFGGPYRDSDFAAAGGREVYKYYYRLRYPLDVSEAGRPKRLSPLNSRLRDEERLGAGGLVRPGQAGAAGRGGAAGGGRLGAAAVARAGGGGACGDSRAGGDHRHDLVREARAVGARRARVRVRRAHRPAGGIDRVHAAPGRPRPHRRRRDRDPARGGSLSRRHRCRRGRLGPRLPRVARRARDRRERRVGGDRAVGPRGARRAR